MLRLNPCNICPRECGTDRYIHTGFCGAGSGIKIARAAPHFWEEPCISGDKGSGTVFFSGCSLKCCYCQNHEISSGARGSEVSAERLADIFIELQDEGVHNINLVTPTHYVLQIIKALDISKPRLHIPVVYNTGGYEKTEAVRALKGYVDIYIPDLKYRSSKLSREYSGAEDYFDIASEAIMEMVSQVNGLSIGNDGVMLKGVIIRHLVLPGARKDSMQVLRWMSENLPEEKFLLSLMNQYTPSCKAAEHNDINRRVTAFEYDSVVEEAVRLGLSNGFIQERDSADARYIPPFNLEGV